MRGPLSAAYPCGVEPQAPILDFFGNAGAQFRLMLRQGEDENPLAVFEVTLPGEIVLTAKFQVSHEAFTFHGAWDSHKLLAAGWAALNVTLAQVQERVNEAPSGRVAELESKLAAVTAERDRLLGRSLGIKLG